MEDRRESPQGGTVQQRSSSSPSCSVVSAFPGIMEEGLWFRVGRIGLQISQKVALFSHGHDLKDDCSAIQVDEKYSAHFRNRFEFLDLKNN